VGDGGRGIVSSAAWPTAAAAAAQPLGSDTSANGVGVAQQTSGTATIGVTSAGDTAVTAGVTPAGAAPRHATGEDPQLDDGDDGVTSDTSVTSDSSSKGASVTSAGTAGTKGGVAISAVDVKPPIVGVVAPVG
jgi:hypothetical protein